MGRKRFTLGVVLAVSLLLLSGGRGAAETPEHRTNGVLTSPLGVYSPQRSLTVYHWPLGWQMAPEWRQLMGNQKAPFVQEAGILTAEGWESEAIISARRWRVDQPIQVDWTFWGHPQQGPGWFAGLALFQDDGTDTRYGEIGLWGGRGQDPWQGGPAVGRLFENGNTGGARAHAASAPLTPHHGTLLWAPLSPGSTPGSMSGQMTYIVDGELKERQSLFFTQNASLWLGVTAGIAEGASVPGQYAAGHFGIVQVIGTLALP